MIKKQLFAAFIIGSFIIGASAIILPKKVESLVLNSLQNSHKNIASKLFKQQQELDILIANAKRKSAAIDNQLSLINSLVNSARSEQKLMQLQSGDISLSSQLQPELAQSEQCNGKKGIIEEVITFDSPFISTPHIITSFQTLDFANGPDHRLKTRIENITKESFTVSFHTWCDTRMSQASLRWLAVGL